MMLLLDTATRPAIRPTVPRAVFCVIDHLHRSTEIAEDAVAGAFTNAGRRFDFGASVDFSRDPFPGDEEWRIEWFKFYFGLDLANAFSAAGEDRFVRTWENLVRMFIEQIPVGFDTSDVAARRVQNWIYAWRKFYESPMFTGFSDGFERLITLSLRRQIAFIRENLTAERNHRTLELYALFIAALALPELDSGKALLKFAFTQLEDNLLTDLQTDGVQREQSTDYHLIVLRSFLGMKQNARLFGLRLSARADERLEKACEFAMHIHRPDGLVPAISDGDSRDFRELLVLAAELFGRTDFLYAATGGRQGSAPNKRLADFGASGYFIQRSGWGKSDRSFADENFLVFDCGPLGDGGHGHYDMLSFEAAGGGKPLIVDTGRYTYSESGDVNWRRFFKSTRAHNTVCVDGLDQTPYRRGRPKKPTASAEFIERVTHENVDVLSGKVVSPMYDAVHTRRIFFVRGEYWIVFDRLRSSATHDYDLRFHLTPDAWNHLDRGENNVNSFVLSTDLALVFERESMPGVEPSWYSPDYGVKHRIPCVTVTRQGSGTIDFLTLIRPLSRRERIPEMRIERAGDDFRIRVGLATAAAASEDDLVFRLDGEKLASVRLDSRGVKQ